MSFRARIESKVVVRSIVPFETTLGISYGRKLSLTNMIVDVSHAIIAMQIRSTGHQLSRRRNGESMRGRRVGRRLPGACHVQFRRRFSYSYKERGTRIHRLDSKSSS